MATSTPKQPAKNSLWRRIVSLLRFLARLVAGLDEEEICVRPAEPEQRP
jgi:hypothetical protein